LEYSVLKGKLARGILRFHLRLLSAGGEAFLPRDEARGEDRFTVVPKG
jgi:hypothetical protein